LLVVGRNEEGIIKMSGKVVKQHLMHLIAWVGIHKTYSVFPTSYFKLHFGIAFCRVRIFSRVRPFCERAVSNLDP